MGGVVQVTNKTFRAPSYENSHPRLVAKSTDFIINHIAAYLSKEGSPDQQLRYSMLNVKPEVADLILEQMEFFKKWVQSLAEIDHDSSHIPFVFVSFGKKLRETEL